MSVTREEVKEQVEIFEPPTSSSTILCCWGTVPPCFAFSVRACGALLCMGKLGAISRRASLKVHADPVCVEIPPPQRSVSSRTPFSAQQNSSECSCAAESGKKAW